MSNNVVSLANARILVVEDDDNNRLVAVKLLQVEGVPREQITSVPGDPVPYLRSLLPETVDLILLDLQLPGKDGYEILAELREDPALAHIPVVVMTANVMRQDVERAQTAGFDGFIGKPINGPRFGSWLQRILEGEEVWAAVS